MCPFEPQPIAFVPYVLSVKFRLKVVRMVAVPAAWLMVTSCDAVTVGCAVPA